jgi:outer membrane protein OmpA-like peptidoglycan-associated protein
VPDPAPLHQVFISYARVDRAAADAIVEGLEAAGVKCFIDHRDASGEWAGRLTSAIRSASVFLLVLSSASNASGPVRGEVAIAGDARIPMLPVRIEEVQPHEAIDFFVRRWQWFNALPPAQVQDLIEEIATATQKLLPGAEAVSVEGGDPAPPPTVRSQAPPSSKRHEFGGAPGTTHPFAIWLLAALVCVFVLTGTAVILAPKAAMKAVLGMGLFAATVLAAILSYLVIRREKATIRLAIVASLFAIAILALASTLRQLPTLLNAFALRYKPHAMLVAQHRAGVPPSFFAGQSPNPNAVRGGSVFDAGADASNKNADGPDGLSIEEEEVPDHGIVRAAEMELDGSAKSVFFPHDGSLPQPSDQLALERLAMKLLSPNNGSIELVGRHCPLGTTEYNMALSDRRAQAVLDFLVRKAGAPRERIVKVPRGAQEAMGTDDSGWARDDRVDIVWRP